MKFERNLLILLFVLLAACSPGGAEPEMVETAVPTSTTNSDAAAYAEDAGISLEEANERLALQDSIGELGGALEANEADTFAGLWIEQEPAYKVVVAFVGDGGEEVIRPYVQNNPALADIIEIRSAQHTLTALLAAQEEAFRIVNQLEPLSVAGGVDIMQNRVYLTVGNPEQFLQAIANSGNELPQVVTVEPIDPNNIPASNVGGVDEYIGSGGQTIYFPRQAPAVAGMDALLEGTLILDDNGCLRVRHESMPLAEAPVVIWHYDFSLAIDGEEMTVVNGEGEPVGRVGEWSRIGGGESRTVVQPEIPEACPGPFWILGSSETLAEQAIPDIFTQPLIDDAENSLGGIFYYQSIAATAEDRLSGVLTVDENGCIRVDGYTIFWPPHIWPKEDTDPLEIVFRGNGVEWVMFAVGDEIELAGGEKTPADYRFFENKIDCTGPFWGVATLTPEQ